MRKLKLIIVATAILSFFVVSACDSGISGIPEESRNDAQTALERASIMEGRLDDAKFGIDLLSLAVILAPVNVSENFSEMNRLLNEAQDAWNVVGSFKKRVEKLLKRNKGEDKEDLVNSTVMLLSYLVVVQGRLDDYSSELEKMNKKLES